MAVAAYSIAQFCKAHDLSRAYFYRLRRAGEAPEVMQLGRRVLIPSNRRRSGDATAPAGPGWSRASRMTPEAKILG
jgi:hypothetical protein